jgi:hypothetical protein
VNTRAQIKRATLIGQRAIESLDAETQQALIDLYKAQADDIAARIRSHAGPDDNLALQELRSLLVQIEGILRQLAERRDALLAEALGKAADYGARPALGAVLDTGAVVASADSMRTSEEALRFVRNFVAADGLQLSDRIWRLDRGARDAVVNAIERAVIQGHGAGQAAREFLSRGEPVPIDIQDRMQSSATRKLIKGATDPLLTGEGSALDNAMRLMRTEINRAHGEAYMMGGEEHPDFGGWRFLLSPAHPKPDICDLLSTQNLHGLGRGVYPSREKLPWPAHPNTLSFVEIVFKDEISDQDKAGKESPLQALARLTPAQRQGVMGKNKAEVFAAGKLTQGMIRAPWRAVQKRIGYVAPKPKAPPRPPPAPKGQVNLDEILRFGADKGNELLAKARAAGDAAVRLPEILFRDLNLVRSTGAEAKVRGAGRGAELVRNVSRLFPDDWTKAADAFGPLYAKGGAGRGWQATLPATDAGRRIHYKGFTFTAEGNDGMIVAGRYTTAVHEYAHRLQHALPGLDDLFQDVHHRRTAGEPIKSLRSLTGIAYKRNEVTREDKYINPYQGKIYSGSARYLGKHGAMEVLTMAIESVLGGHPGTLERLLKDDREMFNLVIGALYRYVP